jgi:hypothetical protein
VVSSMVLSSGGSLALDTSPSPYPEAEGFRGADEPTDEALREARWIDLTRLPDGASSTALTVAVAEHVATCLERRRAVGITGRKTLQYRVGILLAAILRANFRGHVISVHRSSKGGVWKGAVIGHSASWGILDAMGRAGLIGVRKGVQTSLVGDVVFRGLPTRVWAMPSLIRLAECHGITAETLQEDWAINPAVERKRISVKAADLIAVHGLQRGAGRVPVRQDQAAEAAAMRERVAALNDRVRSVEITGCLPPAFRRVFRADLRLGGRFYAVGGSNFQSQPKADRAMIRIGGETVAEVDLHAALLTLLLGLAGVQKLPVVDLYAAVGLPRAAVKAWMVQTFATGRPATRWGRDTPAEVAALDIKATAVRDAAVRTYPAVGRLTQFVPAELLRRLPEERHGWAVGQFLTNLESRVMDSALGYLEHREVVGLPMHDSLIVPASRARSRGRPSMERAGQSLMLSRW